MAHIESTRAVVESDETYDGRLVPTRQAELDRPVRIREGATVQGSIHGGTVETYAGSVIEGSVMAAESIDLSTSHIHSEVGTPGQVTGTDSRIGGTVTGTRVRLVDCVVRGNVVGTDVILENCIVLGLATATRSLTLEGSLCYTFRSHGETHLDETTLVLPQAIADGPLTLDTPITIAGLGPLDVADDESDDLPTMDVTDRYEQNGTTYLTLAPRILNLTNVADRLDDLEQGLMKAVDDTSGDGGADMSVEDVLDLLEVTYDLSED